MARWPLRFWSVLGELLIGRPSRFPVAVPLGSPTAARSKKAIKSARTTNFHLLYRRTGKRALHRGDTPRRIPSRPAVESDRPSSGQLADRAGRDGEGRRYRLSVSWAASEQYATVEAG